MAARRPAGGAHPQIRARRRRRRLVFSILFIWYSRNTGQDYSYATWGQFLMAGAAFLLGIPVYLSLRTRMTDPPPAPAYR